MAIDGIEYFLSQNIQQKNHYEFYFLDNNTVRYMVKSTNLPFPMLESDSLSNGERFYNNFTVGGEFSIEIYENESFDSYQYFQSWLDSVFDARRQVFKINPQSKNAILTFLSKSSANTPTRSFFYEDVKILGFEPISLDYSADEPLTYQLSLTVDNVSSLSGFRF